MKYYGFFRFRDMTLRVETTRGIGDFQSGFWINEDYEMTYGSDARFWIPPGQILYVMKDDE